MTPQQRQLPVARNVAMLGAVVGVVIGCALGATTLLLVDLEARDRIQRATQLRDIVNDMIATTSTATTATSTATTSASTASDGVDGGFQTPCTSCTVYIADDSNDITLTDDSNANSKKKTNDYNNKESSHSLTTLKLMKEASSADERSRVRHCADTGRTIVGTDRRVLYVPVIKREAGSAGETVAVVAFQAGGGGGGAAAAAAAGSSSSSSSSASNSEGFTDEDVVAAKVMARHIAIFMDRFTD